MGYTHSWIRTKSLDHDKFAAAIIDSRRVCEATDVNLSGIENEPEPVFENYVIAFGDGGEPLIIQCTCDNQSPERPIPDKPGFHFGYCKTEQLPYDLCVQATLIILNYYFGKEFLVGSDGNDLEWVRARRLCEGIVGYGGSFVLNNSISG
jgi:hypothetical protein